ncbi:MAG: DegV family protein [Pelolinea sp.]|nr:DegV family protein [Pelolinea sp.]
MVKIIADTLSSIPVEEAKHLGIAYLPQIVIFGEESFRDDSEIDSETFIERLKSSPILPKTTAPYPHLYQPIFDELTRNNDEILIICPSSKVSGTYGRAVVAAQEYPNSDITVLDTPIIGAGLGSVIRMAVTMASGGKSASEISKEVIDMSSRNRTYFLVDTLEYLQKGGRIGAAKALLGSVLQVKPILGIMDGEVKVIESLRTRKKALDRFIEMVINECPKTNSAFLNVQHGGALEEAASLSYLLIEKTGIREIPITNLPPAILVHGGPGLLGVSFFVEK